MRLFLVLLLSFIIQSAGKCREERVIVREHYIQKIKGQLPLNNILVIQGLAGMGKTYLMRTYLEKYRDQYQRVIWLTWDKLSFHEQLLKVSKELRPTSKQDPMNLEKGFVKGLQQLGETVLVVIDNLDDVAAVHDLVTPLKGVKHVTVVLTSRSNTTSFPAIELSGFEENESIAALQGIVPTLDETSARGIAKALGNYPFFVVKVAKMIRSSPTVNTRRILDILLNKDDGKSLNFLNRDDKMDNQGKEIKTRGAKAIKQKLDWMKNEDPKSYEALVFLSHLNTKSIPIDLVHWYFGDENEADNVIEILISNGFISQTDKRDDFITFDIHQVTQQIVKAGLEVRDREKVFKKAPDAFIKFYHKNFSALIDGDREDQVFYAHLSRLIESIRQDEYVLPLKILYLKRSLYSQRDPEEAVKIFAATERNIKDYGLADKKLHPDYLADCIFMKGFMHANNAIKFQEGIDDGMQALQLYESLDNKEGVFKCYTRMAWISLYQENPENCAQYLSKLNLKSLPRIENYIHKEYLFVQSWYNYAIRDYPACIDYCLKGIEIDQHAKNIYLGLYFWAHLSLAYAKVGKYVDAIKVAEEELDREKQLFKKEGTLATATLLYAKGLTNLYQGKLGLVPNEAKYTPSMRPGPIPMPDTSGIMRWWFDQMGIQEAFYVFQQSPLRRVRITPNEIQEVGVNPSWQTEQSRLIKLLYEDAAQSDLTSFMTWVEDRYPQYIDIHSRRQAIKAAARADRLDRVRDLSYENRRRLEMVRMARQGAISEDDLSDHIGDFNFMVDEPIHSFFLAFYEALQTGSRETMHQLGRELHINQIFTERPDEKIWPYLAECFPDFINREVIRTSFMRARDLRNIPFLQLVARRFAKDVENLTGGIEELGQRRVYERDYNLLEVGKQLLQLFPQDLSNEYLRFIYLVSSKLRDMDFVIRLLTRFSHNIDRATRVEACLKAYEDGNQQYLEWFLSQLEEIQSYRTKEPRLSEILFPGELLIAIASSKFYKEDSGYPYFIDRLFRHIEQSRERQAVLSILEKAQQGAQSKEHLGLVERIKTLQSSLRRYDH